MSHLRIRAGLLGGLLASLLAGACSSSQAFYFRDSDYRKILSEKIQEQRIYEAGRVLLRGKLLPLDGEVIRAQEQLFPGYSATRGPTGTHRFILAVSFLGNESFSAQHDLKLTLNDVEVEKLEEITDENLIRSHYPFAYPFYRVFKLTFLDSKTFAKPSQNPWELKVLTPVGSLIFLLPASDKDSGSALEEEEILD